jgi:hypothetical protein
MTKARSVGLRQFRHGLQIWRKVRTLVVMAIELSDPRHNHARQASQATGLRIL